jgi:spermidine synthase
MGAPKRSLWQQLASYVRPKVVEVRSSVHNPYLEVTHANGVLELNTPNANYSFANLHQVFLNTFREFSILSRPNLNTALVLGLGGGSVPKLILEKRPDCAIRAVELDETVVALGHQYFGLGKYHQLEVIVADATQFVNSDDRLYDLIVVDLFLDNLVPAAAETPSFLQALRARLSPGGVLLFNRMVVPQELAIHTAHFQELFEVFFPGFISFLTLDNKVLVYISPEKS